MVFYSGILFSQSPDYEPSLPVSEKSNPLTRDIDRASANCIVRMLEACDTQMFQEEAGETYQVNIFHESDFNSTWWMMSLWWWCHSQRLLSEHVVDTLVEVAKRVELILKVSSLWLYPFQLVKSTVKACLLCPKQDPEDSLVVLSGCGTSGRMAFLISVKVWGLKSKSTELIFKKSVKPVKFTISGKITHYLLLHFFVCVLLVRFQQSAEGDEPEFCVFLHHCRGRQVMS